MKQFLGIIALNIVAIILASLAFWMAVNDKPYYGWVIFAAVITIALPKKISV